MSNERGPDEHEPSRSRQALAALRSRVQPGSFPLLLVAIGFVYLLNGLAAGSILTPTLVMVGRLAVLLAGVYVLSADRITQWLAVLMAGFVLTFEARLWPVHPAGQVLQDGVTIGFLLWVLTVVLRAVFRPATSELDAIVGALCGFMIILTIFTRLHGLIEAVSLGAYRMDGPPLSERPEAMVVATFQYFSTVTMTTVGFGDIVPVAPAARLVTGFEAIVGQLYLAVVIATLVGRAAGRPRK